MQIEQLPDGTVKLTREDKSERWPSKPEEWQKLYGKDGEFLIEFKDIGVGIAGTAILHPAMSEPEAWEYLYQFFKKNQTLHTPGLCLAVDELEKEYRITDRTVTSMNSRINKYRDANDIITLYFWNHTPAGYEERARVCRFFKDICLGAFLERYVDPDYNFLGR
jgi:hypothetical protein